MFQTASGVSIPFPERIEEKYTVSEGRIAFNISFEKLKPFIDDFIADLPEPVFLIIQKPLKEKYKPNSFTPGPFKAELLYLDLQTKERLNEALDAYGEILLNDGMSQFGVRSHVSKDELFIGKYKIAYIFSKDFKKHTGLLDKYGITQTDDLLMAWDTISAAHPGKRSRVTVDGKDIHDVADALKQVAEYHMEIVDDR